MCHYWRVAALLGSKRDQDAAVLLGNLIKDRKEATRSSRMESVAVRSLEPVQGSVRQRMRELEQGLLAGTRDSARPP